MIVAAPSGKLKAARRPAGSAAESDRWLSMKTTRPRPRSGVTPHWSPSSRDPHSSRNDCVKESSGSRAREHNFSPCQARIYLPGHNSRQTAGANSYLLRRPAGNLMIDTPRWSSALAARYETLGPVTDVLLTHRDHAAHGRRYADRLGARLWIHEGDLDAAPDADEIMHGTDPVEIADRVTAYPLPGHTEGSVLYLADELYCFSGDSFYWSRTAGDIAVADSVTWYSITELAASLERTVPRIRFEWLLPGHGDRQRLAAPDMARRLQGLAARTQKLSPRPIDFAAMRW